jgi:hypothetical protein
MTRGEALRRGWDQINSALWQRRLPSGPVAWVRTLEKPIPQYPEQLAIWLAEPDFAWCLGKMLPDFRHEHYAYTIDQAMDAAELAQGASEAARRLGATEP